MSSEDRGSRIEDRKSKIEDRDMMSSARELSNVDARSSILEQSRHSPVGAWFYLVWLRMQRQAQVRQMIWIALGLPVFTATVIALITAQGRWSIRHNRWTWVTPEYRQWEQKYQRKEVTQLPPDIVPNIRQTHDEAARNLVLVIHAIPWAGVSGAGPDFS